VSDAGTYWYFGPGRRPGAVLITIGKADEELRPYFRTVTRYGWLHNRWWVREERDNTIYVAEGPNPALGSLQAVWPKLAGRQ
jgi:hypothetical protein